MNKQKQKGFTLIELLVVIAIIGILSTLAVIALGGVREKARDTKRVADVKQMATALELYYSDNGSYPSIITPGQAIASPDGLTNYMSNIPANPTPRNDGGCPDANYGYSYVTTSNSFYISTCLGSGTGNLLAGGVVFNSDSSITNDVFYGLVGYWKFDEGSGTTAFDSSGNGNNGTWNGSSTTYYTSGKVGSTAGQFNGTDDYLEIADPVNGSLDFGTNDFSFGLWMKTDMSAGELYTGRCIAGKLAGGTGTTNKDIGYQFYAYYSAGWNVNINDRYLAKTPATNLNDNIWHHVFMTRTGDTTRFYIDGDLVGTKTDARIAISVSNAQSFVIGAMTALPGTPAAYFRGSIDDVRIYNRVLTDAEVLTIYNAGN